MLQSKEHTAGMLQVPTCNIKQEQIFSCMYIHMHMYLGLVMVLFRVILEAQTSKLYAFIIKIVFNNLDNPSDSFDRQLH